ncbi:MAG: hypothetical protein AAGI08_00205 [Bacteroidota bacterium]
MPQFEFTSDYGHRTSAHTVTVYTAGQTCEVSEAVAKRAAEIGAGKVATPVKTAAKKK